MAVLGIHIGAYAHVVAAAAGLSVLFHAIPLLYSTVKLAGAAYLVWLGICLFRAKDDVPTEMSTRPETSARKAFAQSVAVEVLNPKTAIFFMAFLPQFIDGTASLPLWAQLAILGAAVNAIFTFADIVSVLLANLIVSRLKQSSRVQRLVQRTGGAVLVGLGTHLALQRN